MIENRVEDDLAMLTQGYHHRSFMPIKGLLLLLLLPVFLAGPAVAQPSDDSETKPSDLPSDPVKAELQKEIESGSDLTSRGRKTLFRARSRQDAGRFSESAELLEKWLEGNPDREHHLLQFQQGIAYLGGNKNELALAALQAAVNQEPRFARAWLRLGETAYELQRFDLAAEAFNQGYELSPIQRPEFLYYACVASLSGGNSSRALADLERLLTSHSRQAPLDWFRALIAAATEAQQPGRAEPFLQAALVEHAEDPEAWELAYRFAAGQQDYEAAATYMTITGYLRELSRLERIQLGDLYAVVNVPLQAARSYAVALEERGAVDSAADPVDVEKTPTGKALASEYERLAGAWLAAHRYDEARATLHQALAKTETRRLWSILGDLEHLAQDYSGALEAYGSACRLDPKFGRGWLMMGYCCQELGLPDEARGHLKKAAEFPQQAASANILLAD